MHERKISLQAGGCCSSLPGCLKDLAKLQSSVPQYPPGSWLPAEALLHVVSLVSAECKSNDWSSVPILLD